MLVYTVRWLASPELTKGQGMTTRKDYMLLFTVLCRNISDASVCLEYLFKHKYQGKFSLCDGECTFARSKIDSRSFDVQYLLMDGMTKPLYLHNCKDSISEYNTSTLQRSVYSSRCVSKL